MNMTAHAKIRMIERFKGNYGNGVAVDIIDKCIQSGDYKLHKFDGKCISYRIPHLSVIFVKDRSTGKIVTIYKEDSKESMRRKKDVKC